MNALLKSEFELFIKNSGQDAIRNGYVTKTIKSLHGEIEVKVPRDRANLFESSIQTKYSSCTEELFKMSSHEGIGYNIMDSSNKVKELLI